MTIEEQRHRLEIRKSVLSGSVFDDVNISGATFHNANMSGWRIDDANLSGLAIDNANLSGARITNVNLAGATIVSAMLDGMTINGVAVTDLLATYNAKLSEQKVSPATSVSEKLNALVSTRRAADGVAIGRRCVRIGQ